MSMPDSVERPGEVRTHSALRAWWLRKVGGYRLKLQIKSDPVPTAFRRIRYKKRGCSIFPRQTRVQTRRQQQNKTNPGLRTKVSNSAVCAVSRGQLAPACFQTPTFRSSAIRYILNSCSRAFFCSTIHAAEQLRSKQVISRICTTARYLLSLSAAATSVRDIVCTRASCCRVLPNASVHMYVR